MTREDFVGRWRARRDELARLGAHVEGAKLCDEVLADFEACHLTARGMHVRDPHAAPANQSYLWIRQ